MLCATLLASTLLTGFYQKFTELRPNVHDFTEEFKQNLVEPYTPSKTEVYSNRLAFSQSLFDALHRDPNVNFSSRGPWHMPFSRGRWNKSCFDATTRRNAKLATLARWETDLNGLPFDHTTNFSSVADDFRRKEAHR